MGIASRLLSSFIVLSAIVVFGVASPVSAAVTYSGENGKIVYSKIERGISSIWKVNQDGKRNQLLVGNGAQAPVWSPGGERVAYLKKGLLLSVRTNGNNRLIASGNTGKITDQVWSMDGTKLAFVRSATIGGVSHGAVFTIDADGRNEKNQTGWIKNATLHSPSWAPDSKRLVYAVTKATTRTVVVKNVVNGYARALTTISGGDYIPAVSWSPNGKKILFTESSNELYTIWPDGSHKTVISDGDSYGGSWSPRGDKIVFFEDPNDDTISISEVNGDITYVSIPKTDVTLVQSVQWAPNGQDILLALKNTETNEKEVYVLSVDGASVPNKIITGKIVDLSWQAK